MIEEILDGHEVDADIVLKDGALLYGKISDNFPVFRPWSLESGQLSPSILQTKIQDKLVDYAFRVSKVLGYTVGVLHVELMLGKDGSIALIEVNGRPGGMYISNWHKEIWGVDLINAQLALAAGIDPHPFLKERTPTQALAQLCVTTNTDRELKNQFRIESWINESEMAFDKKVRTTLWDPLPLDVNLAQSGHPNLGEITVSEETPLGTFAKLMDLCTKNPLQIITNEGTVASSVEALRKFCTQTPEINRFVIRKARVSDLSKIQALLSELTPRAKGEDLVSLPSSSTVLVSYDTFSSQHTFVGCVSLHTWESLRPTCAAKNGYIHDLVVRRGYDNIGIGASLMQAVLEEAQAEHVAKTSLACEEPLSSFYATWGFQPKATFMVKYQDGAFSWPDKGELAQKGDWLFGQDLVSDLIAPACSQVSIPHQFIFTMTSSISSEAVRAILKTEKSYAVKFSLQGDDFKGGGKRGANSSRGRVLKTQGKTEDLIRTEIASFQEKAPPNCANLILQTLIDQQGGCLFHVEFSAIQCEIDLLWEADISTGRTFGLFRKGHLLSYENIEGTGNIEHFDRPEGLRGIFDQVKIISEILNKKFRDVTWSIEGFWRPAPQSFEVLQMRPTPMDRPLSALTELKDIFYDTHFCWGSFQTLPFVFHLNDLPAWICVRKDIRKDVTRGCD